MKLSSPYRQRTGLSLLEVLVAMTIFLSSLIGISQLVTLASERAMDVQQQGEATRLCQSKLAEIVAGAVPLSSQSDVPFDEDDAYHWSLDAEQANVAGLWTVQVTVSRSRPDGSKVEVVLSQMVLDPGLRGSTADTATPAGTDSTASSTAPTTSGTTGTQTPTSASPANASKTPTPTMTPSPMPNTKTPSPTPNTKTTTPSPTPNTKTTTPGGK